MYLEIKLIHWRMKMTAVKFYSKKGVGRISDRLQYAVKKSDEAKAKMKDLLELGRAILDTPEYNEAKMEVLYWQRRVTDLRKIHYGYKKNRNNNVSLGSTVRVKYGSLEKEYTIVTSLEADPVNGYISEMSPLGRALINKKEYDTVSVRAPSGEFEYQITQVE